MLDRSWVCIEICFNKDHAYVYACLSSRAIPTCTHIGSTSGLVWRTVLRPHTSLHRPCSRPPSPHACPCTTSHPHIPSLLLDVQRLSSVVSQASGMGHPAGLVVSSRTPHSNVSLSPDDASMQTQAAGRWIPKPLSTVCRTMVHSACTPTTRPLPRPAAIASRHATSRAMQVTSASLVSQAAPAALFTTQPMSVSRSLMQAHMQGPTLPDTQRGGEGDA
jgi:hypothetical protein